MPDIEAPAVETPASETSPDETPTRETPAAEAPASEAQATGDIPAEAGAAAADGGPAATPRATPELRGDGRSESWPEARPAAGAAAEGAAVERVIVKRRGGWFASLIALLALAVAVFTLLLPSVKPWLQARYGHIAPVGFVLGQKSETDRLREQIARLDGQAETLETRLAAEEAASASASERMARLDAIFGAASAGGAAASATLAGVAAGASAEDQQAWRAAASARIDALAIDFAAVIALQKQNAETIADARDRLAALEAVGGQISALAQRLDGLESGIAGMQPALASLQEAAAAATALAGEVGALSARVSGFEGQAEATGALVSAAEGKMASLEQVIGGWQSIIDDMRLSQAMFYLANVLETHEAFGREIAYVRALSAKDEALAERVAGMLEPLMVYADSGVATRAELRDSFSAIVAPKLLAVSDDGRSWVGRMRSWLGGMIAAETVSADPADPTRQLVTTASRALSEDDLDLAIEAIGRLEGPAAMVAQRWLVEAEARRVLDTQGAGFTALGMELAVND